MAWYLRPTCGSCRRLRDSCKCSSQCKYRLHKLLTAKEQRRSRKRRNLRESSYRGHGVNEARRCTRVVLFKGPGHVEMRCLQAIFCWGKSLGEVLDRHRQLDRAQAVKPYLHGGFSMGLKKYKISLVRNTLDEVKPIAHDLSLWVVCPLSQPKIQGPPCHPYPLCRDRQNPTLVLM
jgi:hypothetical protein